MRRLKTASALLLGLVSSTIVVRPATPLIPDFPAPRPEPSEAIALVQRSLGYPEKTPDGTVVGLTWTTTEAFQSEHPKSDRFRWLSATGDWAWFVTRFDPHPPTGTVASTAVRVDRIRTNGLVEAGVAPLTSSLTLVPSADWDATQLPATSPAEAIGKALSAIGPVDPRRPRLVVGATWSTATHFRPHIEDGSSYSWKQSQSEWAWFVTIVERDTAETNGHGDRVRVIRVLNNGAVHEPRFIRT